MFFFQAESKEFCYLEFFTAIPTVSDFFSVDLPHLESRYPLFVIYGLTSQKETPNGIPDKMRNVVVKICRLSQTKAKWTSSEDPFSGNGWRRGMKGKPTFSLLSPLLMSKRESEYS